MIDLNVIINPDEASEFCAGFGTYDVVHFRSETTFKGKHVYYYFVKATPEMYTFLQLKYGKEFVWKR